MTVARSRTRTAPESLEPGDFFWALGQLCELERVPFDAGLLGAQFPPPYSEQKVLRALATLGFRTEPVSVAAVSPGTFAVPCLAFRRMGGTGVPVIVVERKDDEVLVFEPGDREPRAVALREAGERYGTQMWLVTRETPPVRDPDAARAEPRGFGFGWFVPELLRHRRIWVEVLGASAAIQLVGLALPLFTQVTIDKVIPHQSIATLWAVAVGFAMFIAFGALMNWMRQYLVLHTGTRVDAVLGERVFRHLVRLPLPYFEHRQTGVLVARLNAIEQIREFVAGAAVALLLDCPFLIVYLAVMFWYSWKLTLAVIAALGLVALLSLAVTPLLRARLDRQFLAGAASTAFVTEYVSAMATVKSLQLEPVLEERYGGLLARYLATSFDTRSLANSYQVAAGVLEQTMMLAILVMGALLVMDGAALAATGGPVFTIGMLVAFQMFASRLAQPMLRLVGLWQQFQQTRVAVRRLADIMDMPPEPVALVAQRPQATPARATAIEFREVSFRYSEHHPWLFRGLSFAIRPACSRCLSAPRAAARARSRSCFSAFTCRWRAESSSTAVIRAR